MTHFCSILFIKRGHSYTRPPQVHRVLFSITSLKAALGVQVLFILLIKRGIHSPDHRRFIAYNGAQQIITTLLPRIGALSLGICYTTFAASCMISPAVVKGLGLKTSIAIQLFMLSVWIASNLYPRIEFTIPVALAMGFFAAPFWTAVPTYVHGCVIQLAFVLVTASSNK